MTTGSVRALVLAGGSGTRLWPRSTDACPKPFLKLAGAESLLRQTVARATAVAGAGSVFLSARSSHAALLRAELPEIPDDRLVLEPERRNTAPAIALCALVAARDPGDVLVVLPSDQAVRDEEAFVVALRRAVATAFERDAFVTLGIPPTRAETGFGYLETDPAEAAEVKRVLRFVEKPPRADAERYLSAGCFYWNAGIFVFRVGLLISEMRRLAPDVLAAARATFDARRLGDGPEADRAFAAARSVSIDYAVMEKAREVVTVPCACGWSDLGSWDAVFEFRGGEEGENVTDGPVLAAGNGSNLVLAHERPVRVLGLSDIVVVEGPEGLLVMRRGASDDLRASVEESLRAGVRA